MPDVIVVGAGPVGMLLAGELHRRGVDTEVLERRPSAGAGSRAIGIHAPVLAALEPSGTTERLLADAVRVTRGEARSRGRTLGIVRFGELSTRFPFVATLPQESTERALAAAAPSPLRGAHVTAVDPRGARVRVRAGVGGRPTERDATIVVVATGGGGRGLVYRPDAVRVHTYRDRYLMTDVAAATADDSVAVVNLDPSGVLESFPLPEGRRRFVAWDERGGDDEPSARAGRLREAMILRGDAAAADAVVEAAAFGVRRAIAPRLRRGRVFTIGDAAHEVSPIGGQGMNLGLLDAVTLAPLLARWVQTGEAPEDALRRWEARRVRSARVAAVMASANTTVGRALPGGADALRRGVVRAMLLPPTGGIFARAYAMGFDSGA
ncbi:FAD-dependent oxidoreductase [Microbacterium koreense]|uniref:FAD-dependent oxidoreductase n=1 Tax=Microbacterium koreense TaxID=323761 RepID=A0ABW2ZNA3_9MICO